MYKQILFTNEKTNIYLINFNLLIPEVIQKIEINSVNEIYSKNCTNLIKIIGSFNDDSIYLEIAQRIYIDNSFYDVFYIKQYKIIKNELKEISSIELNKKIISE